MKAIVTVGERLQLIKDWQCSGLTVSEWCRRNGIHKNTFCNWIHRSRKQGLLETPAVIPQPIDQDPIKQDIILFSSIYSFFLKCRSADQWPAFALPHTLRSITAIPNATRKMASSHRTLIYHGWL